MKIALIGATGNIGQHIARVALNRGHAVTAIVRNEHEALAAATQVKGSLGDAALNEVVKGHDVIASAFGPRPDNVDAVIDAAHALVKLARDTGVKRLVVVGGAGSLEVAPGLQLVDAPTFPAAYKAIAEAHRKALAVFQAATDLDWTFYAPAAMIGPGEEKGSFRVGSRTLIADANGASAIHYPDYASAFVNEIEAGQFIREVATVAY
ncbi:NAD(P)H-binding protein [Burkholderiaceae bacterium DAT-1]|nr:NAD(P)H-binding protein [Burkholderiaceae bacterium DAT-1]